MKLPNGKGIKFSDRENKILIEAVSEYESKHNRTRNWGSIFTIFGRMILEVKKKEPHANLYYRDKASISNRHKDIMKDISNRR